MANLELNYQGSGATLYAIVRRVSDYAVWSTADAAFVTWADADLADYALSLADRGGDYYNAASAEPAIDNGTEVRAIYYLRAGSDPATSDLLLAARRFFWGSAPQSASTVALDPYALSDLDSLKRHLRIDTAGDDTLLTELINAVSAEIERVTGVQFLARDYRDRVLLAGQRTVVLPRWPVVHTTRVAIGNATALTVTRDAGTAIRATAGVYDAGLRLTSMTAAGTSSVNSLTFAAYPTASLLVAAVNALGGGWSAELVADTPSADLHPTPGMDALGRAVQLCYPDQADLDAWCDTAAGLLDLRGFPAYAGEAQARAYPVNPLRGAVLPQQYMLIEYRAGYEAIPADVRRKCNVLCQDAYYEGLTDRTIVENTLGPFKWKANADVAIDIREELAAYMDPARKVANLR